MFKVSGLLKNTNAFPDERQIGSWKKLSPNTDLVSVSVGSAENSTPSFVDAICSGLTFIFWMTAFLQIPEVTTTFHLTRNVYRLACEPEITRDESKHILTN